MTDQPTPIRVEQKPCCPDCENPIHRLLAAAKDVATEAQYERIVRELRRQDLL